MCSYHFAGLINANISETYGEEKWYDGILDYVHQSYYSIEERMLGTFRYVNCHRNNRKTFSHEFSSILRDAGSVFDSAMKEILRNTKEPKKGNEYKIFDYMRWLINKYSKKDARRSARIDCVGAALTFRLKEWRAEKYLFPFLSFNIENVETENSPDWWKAYNNVKHREIVKFEEGNLENALNSVAALVILLIILEHIKPSDKNMTKLFPSIHHVKPEYIEELMFFKQEK